MFPATPTFEVATANAPAATAAGALARAPTDETADPTRVRIPSLAAVAASAITSGTGVCDAPSKTVVSPVTTAARLTPSHVNPIPTSVASNGAVGRNASTKLCEPPGAMFTGV